MKVTQVPFDISTLVISSDFALGKELSEKLALSHTQSILTEHLKNKSRLRPIRAAFVIESTRRGGSLEFEVDDKILTFEDEDFVYDSDGSTVGLANWLGTTKPYLCVRLFV